MSFTFIGGTGAYPALCLADEALHAAFKRRHIAAPMVLLTSAAYKHLCFGPKHSE